MTYKEKLLDPRWQKKRLSILERDNFCCRICKDGETTLHVHHTLYWSGYDPWDYEDWVYKTLCKHCHYLIGYFKNHTPNSYVTHVVKEWAKENKDTVGLAVVAFNTLNLLGCFEVIFFTYFESTNSVEKILTVSADIVETITELIKPHYLKVG